MHPSYLFYIMKSYSLLKIIYDDRTVLEDAMKLVLKSLVKLNSIKHGL